MLISYNTLKKKDQRGDNIPNANRNKEGWPEASSVMGKQT